MVGLEDLEIPGFLDRSSNGRCRAYWMAHERCPGGRNPHDWAMENMDKFLKKALELDRKEGTLPACRGASGTRKPRVRQRVRTKRV